MSMSQEFNLEIDEPFFTCIKLGITNVFVGAGIEGFGNLLPGDILQFVNNQYGFLRVCNGRIIQHRCYNTTRELLENEPFEKCVPGVNSIEEAVEYYNTKYTEELLLKDFAKMIVFELINDGRR
jgi:ASC-1-like (ASCH) protein